MTPQLPSSVSLLDLEDAEILQAGLDVLASSALAHLHAVGSGQTLTQTRMRVFRLLAGFPDPPPGLPAAPALSRFATTTAVASTTAPAPAPPAHAHAPTNETPAAAGTPASHSPLPPASQLHHPAANAPATNP
ncbi:hypothetical protein HK405_016041 [Cladochytrium tenue]|nr:hypothetical protein HK405_016041 [Cladochytrium tenue]